jgi:hypothetical protein
MDKHIENLNSILKKSIESEEYEFASEIKEELKFIEENNLQFILFEASYFKGIKDSKERIDCYRKKLDDINYIDKSKIIAENFGEEILESYSFMKEKKKGAIKTYEEMNEIMDKLNDPDEKLAALFSFVENKPYEESLFEILLFSMDNIIKNMVKEKPEKEKELEETKSQIIENKDLDSLRKFTTLYKKYDIIDYKI